MAHVNRQIRDAVKQALRDSEAFRAVTSSQVSLVDTEMPAAAVSAGNDTVEPHSKGTSTTPARELRTLPLTVAIVTESDPETVEDDLDALRATVEPLVVTALAGIARLLSHTGSQQDLLEDEEGERWFGALVLAWEVEVVTAVGDPETALVA